MKKILFVLFAAVIGISAQSQEQDRLVISAGQLQHITLGEHMKVVLISSGSVQEQIKGDMKVFEKLSVSIIDGKMSIAPGRKFSLSETVYVIVNDLKTLNVGEKTTVTTQGILNSGNIKVYVNQGAVAKLRSLGDVNGYSDDGVYVSVQKTQNN